MVFGRHGGDSTFDLEFVHSAIRRALEERSDIWFLFLNTDRFLEHQRIVHLQAFTDRADIRRFVNSCDYMLHAKAVGESFGLAVAEFAFVGVPVLTFLGSPELAHLDLLTDRLLIGYTGFEDVFDELTVLERREAPGPVQCGRGLQLRASNGALRRGVPPLVIRTRMNRVVGFGSRLR